MWIETIIEDGKEILQLQYEQIVFLNLISEMMEELQAGLTMKDRIFINSIQKRGNNLPLVLCFLRSIKDYRKSDPP